MTFEPLAFTGGLIGGAFGTMLSHPFDTWKVVYQEKKYTSLLKCAVDIYKNFGLKGFYKGVGPPIIGIGLEKCIVFGCYNNTKDMGFFQNFYGDIFMAGIVSGLFCTSVVTPVEKIKIKVQNSTDMDIMLRWKNIRKTETIKSLYKGWNATLFREVPGYGIYFCIYEGLKKNFGLKWYSPIIYGSMSGFFAWSFIYPADPVKTRMQNQNLKFKVAVQAIYRENGFRGFYRGFPLGLMRALPMHSGVFCGYELFMYLAKKY